MSKYSRQEKGKWIPGTPKPKNRVPIPIPPSNNQPLIEDNKLTLIGRVTNPTVQRPKALVEFMIEHWNMEARASGKEISPSLFIIRFQSEDDLLAILNKTPYHFKRWMFILQRWEPIVSDYFPAFIPFWIDIQGIPLHHWNDQTLRTIGAELGFVEERDVDRGRIRVRINALEPLEMKLPIRLPSGEVTTVTLVYDKLEKHCFSCFSLSHEERDCPIARIGGDGSTRDLGTNQRRTLTRIEEGKLRQEDRRYNRTTNRERRERSPAPLPNYSRSSRLSPQRTRDSSHAPSRERSRDRSRDIPSRHREYSPRNSFNSASYHRHHPSVRRSPTLPVSAGVSSRRHGGGSPLLIELPRGIPDSLGFLLVGPTEAKLPRDATRPRHRDTLLLLAMMEFHDPIPILGALQVVPTTPLKEGPQTPCCLRPSNVIRTPHKSKEDQLEKDFRV
ncbi:unnamed protein product [Microthlaspi erraticum]|uniref:DUF4283 domain-containing protein n=1 Tax=Microthlaspi erraticum TaxID=1685480 RepID=A0A6D2HDA2_9BRAS|nr:unnamed protein product [Microthlaspi erraticum]